MPTIDDYIRDLPSPSNQVAAVATCPICYESYDDPVQLPCRGDHVFCRKCIQEWLENANTCPMDREVLIEYDDEYPNAEEHRTVEQQLILIVAEHIAPMIIKLAYCRAAHMSVDCDDLADSMQHALDTIRDKVNDDTFNTSSVMGYLERLTEVDEAVQSALNLAEEATPDQLGYQVIRETLTELKGLILGASRAADDVME